MITRRFLLGTGAILASIGRIAVSDSTEWKAGSHYTKVDPALPTSTSLGRVEVAEFFWYGCPHCFILEPHLVLWLQTKPGNVDFVRKPATWRPECVAHARLYYALKALGRDDLDCKVFDALHRQRRKLVAPEDQVEFAQESGIDPERFEQLLRSDEVDSAVRKADTSLKQYRITGVPTIAVNGKYVTDVGHAGTERGLTELLTYLVNAEGGSRNTPQKS